MRFPISRASAALAFSILSALSACASLGPSQHGFAGGAAAQSAAPTAGFTASTTAPSQPASWGFARSATASPLRGFAELAAEHSSAVAARR